MAYATQSSVEAIIGRPLTDSEVSGLPALLDAVDAYINGKTGRTWSEPTEAIRYYDVERSRLLDIDQIIVDTDKPLRVFYVDADETSVGSDIDASDYEARPRNEQVKTWLQRRSGTWGSGCPSNVTNIAVKAYFGSTVPADITYVASWLAAYSIGQTQSLSLKSETIEGYSRTFADGAKTQDGTFITDTLARYREILIG